MAFAGREKKCTRRTIGTKYHEQRALGMVMEIQRELRNFDPRHQIVITTTGRRHPNEAAPLPNFPGTQSSKGPISHQSEPVRSAPSAGPMRRAPSRRRPPRPASPAVMASDHALRIVCAPPDDPFRALDDPGWRRRRRAAAAAAAAAAAERYSRWRRRL